MNVFQKPPKTQYTVLNLGAGVQSSCVALMAAHGEIETPDFAVFADTGAEPQNVYDWLKELQGYIDKSPNPYPVYVVRYKESLTAESLKIRVRQKDGKSGSKKGDTYLKRIIPVFGLYNGKKTAAIGRKCTRDYKVEPILREIKKRCGIKRGQKEITVTQYIGISWDEMQRAKLPSRPWTQHHWPLLEKRMNRQHCIEWMKDKGYPEPPRSACYYCPFHSDAEWRRLRDEDPEHFSKAVEFDKELRNRFRKHDPIMQMDVYLHQSCKPLGEIDFDSDEQKGQAVWDFKAECEGMCGI